MSDKFCAMKQLFHKMPVNSVETNTEPIFGILSSVFGIFLSIVNTDVGIGIGIGI